MFLPRYRLYWCFGTLCVALRNLSSGKMVAVFDKKPGVSNKELLSSYFITLMLNQRSVVSPNSSEQQQQQRRNYIGEVPNPSYNDWVITIKERLKEADQEEVARSWSKFCIYKIPNSLREGDDKAYVPQTVSLGPYHYDKECLRDMDRHKWRSLCQVLKRSKHDIKVYLNAMKELEEEARACYEGPITLGSNEFVKMLVLDGCFMLELFRGAAHGFKELGYRSNDPVFAMRGSMHSIKRDMIMLENQLPLFVLERLLDLQMNVPDQKGYVSELILTFFDPLIPSDKSDLSNLESSLSDASNFDPLKLFCQGHLHCLDVFRGSLLRGIQRERHTASVPDKRQQQLIHCVTELRESGIKFQKGKTGRLGAIKFEDGVLWIPRLLIQDGTKSLFLNLIAFEQCHLDCSSDITSYVIFMDNLINSPEDVGYLHYSGIIEHWLGSDVEVSNLFNQLCQEVVFDSNDSYLSQLSEQVNRYYNHRWNHRWNTWRANFQHNYFHKPWTIISFFVAVVLLLLTFAQTFYSVYGYYNPIG